ncbi:TPA: capsid cement protein [Vibrio vulnificus]
MRLADGLKLDMTVPANGTTKDVPVLYGSLLVVPNMTAKVGEVISAHWRGYFDGPIKEGDAPAFLGEPAYFEAGAFTKTKPTTAGEVAQPVGAFIDNGVLLTGELITEFVAA